MIDIDNLEIGTIIYHKGRDQEGVHDATCVALQALNPDPTSIFVSFDGEPLEVDLKLCEEKEFEPARLCQTCFRPLKDNEHSVCTSCGVNLHNKLGGYYGR